MKAIHVFQPSWNWFQPFYPIIIDYQNWFINYDFDIFSLSFEESFVFCCITFQSKFARMYIMYTCFMFWILILNLHLNQWIFALFVHSASTQLYMIATFQKLAIIRFKVRMFLSFINLDMIIAFKFVSTMNLLPLKWTCNMALCIPNFTL